jgi:hypothetical protein
MGGKSSTPPAPDYSALAKEQAGLNKEAFEYQTKANRVDQTNPYGSTKWDQDPTTGEWSQNTQYNPEYQAILDAKTGQASELTDTAGGLLAGVKNAYSTPFDTSGFTQVEGWKGTAAPDQNKLSDWGSIDYSDNPELGGTGFGAVQEVQDAMMSRLRPGLEQGNAAEIARLKAQGITEGTPAWQAAMQSQGQRFNDAEQQALLGAAGEYGNIFDRTFRARQLADTEETNAAQFANSLRGQQWGEEKDVYGIGVQNELLSRAADTEDRTRQYDEGLLARNMPLDEYQRLTGAAGGVPNLSFGDYYNQGNAGAADVVGAAGQDYDTRVAANNIKNKNKGGLLSGIGSVAGGIIGGIYGGGAPGAVAGSSIGGAAGGALSSFWG